MLKFTLIILCILVSTSNSAPSRNKDGCTIMLPKQNDILQPVLLTNKSSTYNFLIPNGNSIHFDKSEQINILCSPEGRSINLTSLSCYKNESFSYKNKYINFENITCKGYVKAGISNTNKKCGKNLGNIINIGYQTSQKQFLTLITACFDSTNENALYTNHTVYGQAATVFSQQSFRPSFSDAGLPRTLRVNDLYKQKNQKNMLEKLLGSNSLMQQYYSNSAEFLSRGHLSPDADFVYAPLQFGTYFYINVCPQWQSINAGNWLAIEVMVRNTAKKLKKPLQVYTGTHEILTLPDVRENPVEIYLGENERIPVPKYMWKIVYDEQSKQGIAFVAINNPFLDDIDDSDILCPDICNDYKWRRASFSNTKRGYVYCCDVMALRSVIPTIPYLRTDGILRG